MQTIICAPGRITKDPWYELPGGIQATSPALITWVLLPLRKVLLHVGADEDCEKEASAKKILRKIIKTVLKSFKYYLLMNFVIMH